ncbi:HprK-related kinase A [Photobacterium chitinilyticum]|uniref:HprK-related kinase A n=1 Tax=Photobacterium chitinilyticum TaxID=2485123 RepID=A0A444JSQ5_9GAMM|nr:HprK-related kinase A [Photobacterium chitinilyticum]RWX56093.1 HprK-related kinase A [Photobacterium chitinilyticum]
MLLSTQRYYLQTGPFITEVETSIPSVQRYLKTHYQDNLLADPELHFVDFHVSMIPGMLGRRWIKPQARFYFNGREPFKPLPLNQAPAMLEWGMNWLITNHAHQYLIIHAATLEKNGKGIVISAPSGSGKSTLCAYLVSQGWRLLSDELALVCPETLQIHGLARPINLKNNAIELARCFLPSASFGEEIADTLKGKVCLVKPPKPSVARVHISAPISLIVFVKYSAAEQCYVEQVEKCEVLMELITNSFNFGLLNQTGFACAKQIVEAADAIYIEYNQLADCEVAIRKGIDEKDNDTKVGRYSSDPHDFTLNEPS